MKNITGHLNHKVLLLLIYTIFVTLQSFCHSCMLCLFWLGRGFVGLFCFASSVKLPSHEHFVTHIAFLYCTRVGDHVPSVEEMNESRWLYFRWHCAFLYTKLTWCLAFSIFITQRVCSFSILRHAAVAFPFLQSAVDVPQFWVCSLLSWESVDHTSCLPLKKKPTKHHILWLLCMGN